MARTITFVGPAEAGKLSQRIWFRREQVLALELFPGLTTGSDDVSDDVSDGPAILLRLAGAPSDHILALAAARNDTPGTRERAVERFGTLSATIANEEGHASISFEDLTSE